MRALMTLILLMGLWTSSASAAMFGDVAIPDALHPRLHGPPRNNSLTVMIPLSSGGEMVLYISQIGETAPQGEVLSTIARSFGTSAVQVYNLGGRPWFGTRTTLSGGVVLYSGRTHRNGILYTVAFSLNTMPVPDSDVKRILSRIFVTPGIGHSSAAALVVHAADLYELGEFDDMQGVLAQAENLDSGNWMIPYLRGRLAEAMEEFTSAAALYQQAHSLFPQDVELAARSLGMTAIAGSEGTAIDSLYSLGTVHPDEAIIWETMAKVYLIGGDMESAQDYFEEALAVNPSSEPALYNLAFLSAQEKEYEQTFRYSREFMHYRPWLPVGIVPDVSAAPGMGYDRVQQLLAEPLYLGYVGEYGSLQAMAPLPEDIAQDAAVIYVQPPAQVVTPVYNIYETHIYESYVPLITYAWSWNPRYHRSRGHWDYGHTSRPSWQRPRPPSSRPPVHRPPARPGQSRPPRPGQGSGRPGNRPGDRPGDRPGSGPSRPGGDRPGTGGPSRPGDRPGTGSPSRPNDRPGNGTPSRPGNRPERPGNDRPTPSVPRPPVTTLAGTVSRPPSRPERPTQPPQRPSQRPEGNQRPGQTERPERPAQRPEPSRPTTRPQPADRPQQRPETPPRPSRPQQRPDTPQRPSAPQRPERPKAPEPPQRQPEARPQRPAAPGPRPPTANTPNTRPARPPAQARPAPAPKVEQPAPSPARPRPGQAPRTRQSQSPSQSQPRAAVPSRPARREQPAPQVQSRPAAPARDRAQVAPAQQQARPQRPAEARVDKPQPAQPEPQRPAEGGRRRR